MAWIERLTPWRRLSALGYLSLNRRNGDYILAHNPRSHYPLVDDKLRTKELALAAGIAVPQLYAVIEIEHQVGELTERLSPYEDFAVKPAHGSGGEGILVITGRNGERYRRNNGEWMERDELAYHVSNILSGMYSLGGLADKALIEYRVRATPLFQAISHQGVPDIRIIVYRGVPVMAMARLPTRLSDGKANLNQGAVGVGVDLASGVTGYGVWRDQAIDRHPDTNEAIAGLVLPQWDEILRLAACCYELTDLGYIGVDIVLDRDLGPLILEVNARPGLTIQLANRTGLLPRLQRVDALGKPPTEPQQRVEWARRCFERSGH